MAKSKKKTLKRISLAQVLGLQNFTKCICKMHGELIYDFIVIKEFASGSNLVPESVVK